MNRTVSCPHCGEHIWSDTEHAYCMYCGQPVDFDVSNSSEQTQSIVIDDSYPDAYRPKKMQTFAGVLMVLALIMPLFLPFLWVVLVEKANLSTTPNSYMLFNSTITGIVFLIGLALLIRLASNKAIRVAAIGFVCLQLLQIILNYLLLLFSLPTMLFNIIWIIMELGWIYFISLIIRNSQLSSQVQGWLSLLCIICVIGSIRAGYFLWSISLEKAIDYGILYMHDSLFYSSCYTLFDFVINIFSLICYWKLARCEAFNGEFDTDHKDDFSPLHKWMAMGVIAPFIIGLALYFYYLTPTL